MPSRLAERSGPLRESSAPKAAERRRIVASKLSAPRLRPGIVDRPRLVADRIATTDVPVVLVSAPAGYGKTTLLALWRARDERPFVWVSLEATDNDPVALIRSVVSALDPVLDFDGAVAEALAAPQPALEDFVLPTMVDACAAAAGGFVLVLDNVHALTDARSLAAVGYLGERLPAGCQLAMATRVEPALPLASWRAHGRLAEVRAAELSLRDTEAGAVLAAAGVRLAADQVARLVERTEGWPAAIYLAALSLRERSRPEEFVDRFAGTSRHVADFLTEDVLARQPAEVIGFLSRTCVLEDLTASLCDALTGDDHGAAMLRELERTNLFVIPLDDDRWAYRYHHLFAEYLRADLARRDPGFLAELHRRAWRWYREHGLVGRAVAHAQACGDVEVAAELVSAAYPLMLEHGEIETLRGWISGFEDSQIEGHAPLAIAAAHIMSLVGEGERAAHFAQAAQAGSWEGAMPDGSASLESALAMLASTFASGGLSGMCRAAQRAVELEPPTSQWRPLALRNLGVALTLTGDFAAARRALDEAVGMAGGETTVGYVALAFLAMIDLRDGDEEGAFQHAHRAHATAERPGWRNFMPSIYAYGVMADVLSRRGQHDEAAEAVQRATELLPRPTESLRFRLIETRIRLAPTLATLGRRDEAKTRLEEAAALLAMQPDAGVLPEWHREAVQAVRGRRSTSPDLSDAERRILRLLATDLTLRDIGRELYLSHNTVKTHTRAIYRKLGVSSRTELRKAMAADRRGVSAQDQALTRLKRRD